MLRTISKAFEFQPSHVGRLTFSDTDKIVISGADGRILLKSGEHCYYPLDDDIWFKTELFSPGALTHWIAIQPEIVAPAPLGVPKAEIKFKLNDGTDDYYWDGGDWAVAGATDWTTMIDLQMNFPAFPGKSLAIVSNLISLDEAYTPEVHRIALFFEARINSWIEEYLYDMTFTKVKEYMEEHLSLDWSIVWAGGFSADLSAYRPQNGYIILDWLEVYRYDDDPDREIDLLADFDKTTKVMTLSEDVSAGTRLFVRVNPEVELAVSTHADWRVASHLPAIIFRQYEKKFRGQLPAYREKIVNYDTLEAQTLESPRRVDLDVPADVLADRAVVQARIMELLRQLSEREPILTSPGVGAEVWFEIIEDAAFYPRPDEEGVLRGVVRFILANCKEWYFASGSGHAIKQVVLGGDPMEGDC